MGSACKKKILQKKIFSMSSQTENKESSPAVSAYIPTTEKANAAVEQPNQESKRQRVKYSTAVTKHHPPFVKMIQRGMNKAQIYHYLRDTFGVIKGGSTPARVQKALLELRKAGKAKILERGVWKAGAEKNIKFKSLKSSVSKGNNVKASCSTLKTSKRAMPTKTNSKKGSKKVSKPKRKLK